MFRSRYSIEHTNRLKHTRTFIITTHFRYYIKILIFHTCAIRDVTLHKINADKTQLFAGQHVSVVCVHPQGGHVVDRWRFTSNCSTD